MREGRVIFRLHAIRRMYERRIGVDDVRVVLAIGRTIEEYPDDAPYPSCLILGLALGRPLHVVVAFNSVENESIVITVYEPDVDRWEPDLERRRR